MVWPSTYSKNVAHEIVFGGRVSVSGHMFWERNLRTVSKITSKKKDNSPSGKKDALRRATRKAGNGGGGGGRGGGGGGGGEGGGGEDGRPSVGTWTKAQTYLQILKELSGKVGFAFEASCQPLACLWKRGVPKKLPGGASACLSLSRNDNRGNDDAYLSQMSKCRMCVSRVVP